MNLSLPPQKQTKLMFSSGWLTRFQKRWNLKSIKSHGESGDADQAAIDRQMPLLRSTIQFYKHCDVFNADEFGHFYRMAPDRTIASERLPGRKCEKVRLTYLACCNADGSERLPLMCIGKAKKPRCFKKQEGQQLGFDYHANKKAWMTSALFFAWILRFSSYISRSSPSRKVLLLLDNCSAHGTEETLPLLDNVEVVFLPPNTTSKLQPLDAGIIAALKVRYRKWQYERALDYMDAKVENIYKVDQLTSMKAMRRMWDDIPASVLKNCWHHTGLVMGTEEVQRVEDSTVAEVLAAMSELVAPRTQMDIDFITNPEDENNVLEEADDTTLVSGAVAAMTEGEVESEESDAETASYLEGVGYEERLRCIVVVRHLLESADFADPLVLGSLRTLQRDVKLQQAKSARQTRISEFFE